MSHHLYLYSYFKILFVCLVIGTAVQTEAFSKDAVGLTNQSLAALFCGNAALPSIRDGQGPAASVAYLDQQLPAPSMDQMLVFDPSTDVKQINFPDGRKFYVATFKIKPFQADYPNQDIFEQIQPRIGATLAIPIRNGLHRDAMIFSVNTATSNGLPKPSNWDLSDPKKHDPVRTIDQTPDWFSGTLTKTLFETTYGKLAYDMNLPILFYDVVPNKLIFRPQTEDLLRQWHFDSSPEFTCDDLQCQQSVLPNGQIKRGVYDDGPINQCLTQLSYMDPNRPELVNYYSGAFYSLVMDRAMDASQTALNQLVATLGGGSFDLQKVISIGGSKRGVAVRTALAALPRVVAAQSGHSNSGNFYQDLKQKTRIYSNEPPNFYEAAPDQLNFFNNDSVWNNLFRRYDPAYWAPSVLVGKKLVITWGTNDTYFLPSAERDYSAALPSNTDYLAVVNYPHGGGTVDHAVFFKQLLNEVLNQQTEPHLTAIWDLQSNLVTANITGDQPDRIELWCSDHMTDRNIISLRTDINTCQAIGNTYKADPPDLRYATLVPVMMAQVAHGEFQATPPIPTGGPLYEQYQYCVVRASKGLDDYVVTSQTLDNQNLCTESLLQLQTPAD